ncbi:poly(A) RNA polymerase, mitochondrial-like [Diadema antillarum]|uniref:poly(A) RNA polymerase, mitochondrial-like n=1 Tax=Diadema antillarum TaxID=105358 RepID=UPI003A83C653
MTQSRKHQASRSLLVRLSKDTPLDSLLQYCNSQGRVKHYFTYFQKQAHYVVVEFSSPDTVQQISQKAHNSDGRPGSQHSKEVAETRFLSFSRLLKQREKTLGVKEEPTILNKDLNSSELLFSFAQAKTVDEQLELLVRNQELRDAETRLRFLACSLMEEAFQRILPDATLHPFGSSVNGFGKRSCDVDMYLDRGTAQGVVPQKQGRNTYKLSYDRQSAHSERAATQSTLFTLAEFLERHVPQCSFVTRILRARCPLVKFKHQATGLACDLTGDNRIALKSSEMLYIYGRLDPRVRPLVFMVRHWARLNGITHSNPGYWITNYPLTLLVLFFLQTRPEPVLPALSKIALFEPALEGMEEEEKDVELVFSNAPHIPASRNTETPTELLREFFHFCASFPFEKYALSVHHGSTYLKPVTGKALPLYIENPLELELNTCKNVTGNLVDRLRRLSREAVKTMDQLEFYQCDGDSSRVHSWGLGALLVGSVHGKGRKRSAAMEKKLGAMFKALGKRDYSTYPNVDSWWHRSLYNGHRPR